MTYKLKISIYGNFIHFNYIGDLTIDRAYPLVGTKVLPALSSPSSKDSRPP